MIQTVTPIILILMVLSILACSYRVVMGPTISDRIVALDAVGTYLIGTIGLIMILQDSIVYSDVILVIAILSFTGSVALAKFIERGVVLDRDSD